ncbi:MAG: hypothetical protein QNJ19_04795 [Woeseiaceae bacterium]|nr:hypothetical protein [Woeseiaceae bacterium]
MRILIVSIVLASAAVWASDRDDDYSEDRVLAVDSDGVELLDIDAGAGSLKIVGTESPDDGIVVLAVVRVDTDDEDKARDFIRKRLELTLDRDGDKARLVSRFNTGLRMWSPNGRIDLEVKLPKGTAINIDDGSGSLVVDGVAGDLRIDDGSGSLRLGNVGNVEIDDGSGGIEVSNVTGDVLIDDGSGGMTVKSVAGNITISDGSGGITVDDVRGDLTIEEEGSGSVHISNVDGVVTRNDE